MELRPGERLAIVGENGAGKTSLMNVLYGLYQPDRGAVLRDGAPIRLRSPRDAIGLSIGMVHQHFMLVPTLTVTENVVLGREPARWGAILDLRRARARVRELSERLSFGLDPDARVSELPVGAQQKVELVKALYRDARTLILDEPTATLTPQESQELFATLTRLSAEGRTIGLISHRLQEVLSFATRIVVMRRGRLVAEVTPADTTAEALAALMVGTTAAPPSEGSDTRHPPPMPLSETRPERLSLRDVHALDDRGGPALRGLSLTLRGGELVGLAGVEGNGQTELAELLTGLRRPRSGELRFDGAPVDRWSPGEARRRGVRYIPADRARHGIIASLQVRENLALTGPVGDLDGLLERFDVRPRAPSTLAGLLSGGNQQKLVLARELEGSGAPAVVVANQPTRGLDFAAKRLVHAQLRAARDGGCAVLVISSDLEELLELSDRIVVQSRGRIVRELSPDAFDAQTLGGAMLAR